MMLCVCWQFSSWLRFCTIISEDLMINYCKQVQAVKQYCAINWVTQHGIFNNDKPCFDISNSLNNSQHVIDTLMTQIVCFWRVWVSAVGLRVRVSQKCLGLICNTPVILLAACKCSLTWFEEARTALFRHCAEMRFCCFLSTCTHFG